MEMIVISLLIVILVISSIGGLLIYMQIKKNQQVTNNPIEVQSLQDEVFQSKEILKIQVENLEKQLNEFKTDWNGSDRDKTVKLAHLMTNIENFQKSLVVTDIDNKRTADVIRTQVSEVIKDLAKLQQSSTVLGKINDNVQSLQEVFINTKKRGSAGEFVLEKILTNMLGSNQKLWERQYKTIDGKIIDAYVKTDAEKEGIAIDSKFSLDNYQKYLVSEDSKVKENYLKDFRNDIRKRIDEVAKYINIKNKISSAVMFIPSEEIFAFIYAQFGDDIVEYAFKKRVWMTSPTTLSAVLFTVDKNRKDIDFNKNLEKMAKKLRLFKDDFERWVERWEKVKTGFDTTNKVIENLDKTHNKIAGHYNNIFEMSEEIKESE
ncbi:DNA recombination protein RmuC [Spiroplasma endosymbiont of Polydrusus pterygomalis]|uniref:DNA recombination protein RmuC n=1 Tax=Spiroplasma endosymbiont of Polydrusus pterygomalis TaxID=3139327 RepID=UPI003CCA8073